MAKVLIEHVRIDRAGDRDRQADVIFKLIGAPETISEISTQPVLSTGAPDWGKDNGLIVTEGYERVTCLVGAVLCAWGGQTPAANHGLRIAEGQPPVLVNVRAGDKLAFVEAPVFNVAGVARADLQAAGNESMAAVARALATQVVAPITGTFSSSGQSAPFAAAAGRPINITLQGGAAWQATVSLRRKLPGDTLFRPLTLLGAPWGVFTAPASEPVWEEPEAGALFVLDCAYVSGAVHYRISQ